MVPTVIERSSWIDRERPIRLYRFDDKDKHKTIRLTTGWARTTTGACRRRTGRTRRCSASRTSSRNIGGRGYELYYNGPHLHMVVLRAGGATLLGRQHAARPALERDDARDRQGPASRSRQVVRDPAARGSRQSAAAVDPSQRSRVFGAGYVGLVTGACFAELGHDVVVRDVAPGADRGAAARRGADLRARPRRAARAQRASGSRSRSTSREAIDGADFVYVAVGTPPTYSGDADLSAVWTVIDELPAIERRASS